MATSKIGICNMALARIGAARVNALDYAPSDQIPIEAELCLLWYDQILDEVLTLHNWNFAIEPKDISAASTTAPAWGYTNRYTLPTNPYCLRVIRLDDQDIEWRRQGNCLVMDESEAKILYMGRETDAARYTALFIAALYTRLAQRLLPGLSEKYDLAEGLEADFQRTMSDARHFDAVECSVEEFETTTWLESRE